MIEQQIPARISHGFVCGVDYISASYIRADITERMAEALERSLSWLTSYPGDGALGVYEQARSALTAFKAATQDTEARHD